jgi:hypothetical protein
MLKKIRIHVVAADGSSFINRATNFKQNISLVISTQDINNNKYWSKDFTKTFSKTSNKK